MKVWTDRFLFTLADTCFNIYCHLRVYRHGKLKAKKIEVT